jgi:glutathione S-transferase
MITLYGEGRGLRVAWMLEEMRLPYRLVKIDLLSDAPHDPDFLAINPSAFIPALRDGDVTIVESIAILEYLAARHGPTPLVPEPSSAAFPAYKQFLMMGEAGLASAAFMLLNIRRLEPERQGNPSADFALEQFHSRLRLVARQLDHAPYMAGDSFTAADISVTYGLNLGFYMCGLRYEGPVPAYLDRVRGRDGYLRALDACDGTKRFYARIDNA